MNSSIFCKGCSWALLLCLPLLLSAQYPPAAGQPGSTAVHYSSTDIVAWATQVLQQQVGPIDIRDPQLGTASSGTPAGVLGPANDGQTFSLGDAGSITLYFPNGIPNRTGFDFAIFENGFSDTFLELAFVEVSSDGQQFVRFPAASLSDTTQQTGPFGATYPEEIHNLAGKYRAGYGTPFDLADLQDSSGIDLSQVRYIRIIDVVGSIDDAYARYDAYGRKVNDPFPTPFPSGGFDLDAVALLDQSTANQSIPQQAITWYPNRLGAGQQMHCSATAPDLDWRIWDMQGQLLRSGRGTAPIRMGDWPAGTYVLEYGEQSQRFYLY